MGSNRTKQAAHTDEAIILAGGFGTRLQGVVADVPKPMAPVAGRAFLYYLLDALAAQGVGRVILAVHHLAEVIEAIGPRYRGLRLEYLREETPLGTGGAIRQALSRIEGEDALVLNGDTYLEIDYQAVLHHRRETDSDLVLAVRPVADGARYSLVETDATGRVAGFLPTGAAGRPGLIGAGVYALRRGLFDGTDLPPGAFSFETDFLARLTGNLRVQTYRCAGYFIDIGVPDDYRRAQTELPDIAGVAED